ncbi:MAG: hypothetical protein ACD_39C01112G0002 [uncultured bacterium]|nr:MAG: hypothetical protein ACD_39C01112G0002 [uncultured bacterium]
MTRSEFLNRLEKALGNMKWEQKKEVLYDYEEYFANALSDGKTEEQAAQELGNPEEIALSFFQDDEKEESGFNTSGGFASAIKGMVKSALNFASKSINEVMKLEKVEIDSIANTEIALADALVISGCKGADVKIIRTAAAHFSGRLKGVASTDPQKQPCLSSSYLENEKKISFFIDWKGQHTASITGDVSIEVPESFCGTVSVETVSGSLLQLPSGLRCLTFKSVSGEVQSEEISLKEEVRISTVSGKLRCSRISCSCLHFKSVSGGLATKLEKIDTVDFDSTSGSLHLELPETSSKVLFNTISGGIKLRIRNNSGIDLSFKSISGRLKTDLPFVVETEKKGYGSYSFKGRLSGENQTEISGKTISGSLRISKEE